MCLPCLLGGDLLCVVDGYPFSFPCQRFVELSESWSPSGPSSSNWAEWPGPKRCVYDLSCRTCKCDFIWKSSLCRWNQDREFEMDRSSRVIWAGPKSKPRVLFKRKAEGKLRQRLEVHVIGGTLPVAEGLLGPPVLGDEEVSSSRAGGVWPC